MIKEIPIKNSGKTDLFIGSSCIPPDETRFFPENIVPPHMLPKPQAVKPKVAVDPVTELLKLKVNDIKKALPGLSVDDLKAVSAAESERDKPRTSILSAVDELLLESATQQEQGLNFLNRPDAEVIEDLGAVEDLAELQVLLSLAEHAPEHQQRPDVNAAIADRIAALSGETE